MGLSIHKSNINLELFSGIILGAGVLAGGACFLHPFTTETSYATNSDVSVSYSGEDWVISAPTSTAADAGGLNFDIEGNPNGVNMAKKDTVTAGSTNVPNYQIYVSVDTEGGKIPNTSNSEYSIAATSGTVTDATDSTKLSGADTLSNNSWGYALSSFNSSINYNDLVSSSSSEAWSSSKWSKLPYIASTSKDDKDTVESTAAKIYDSTTGSGGSVDVYYAVNANNDLASGEYQTTVTYTLIGEMPVTAITDGMNMQDVTSDMCTASASWDETGTEYTLKDTRDNNSYKIRRLADGNCWMVQNLKLSAETLSANSHATKLDSSDTDLPSGTTFTVPATSNTNWGGSSYTIAAKIANSNNADYGMYYNWWAAVASTNNPTTQYQSVDTSICPKGWDLPKGQGASTYSTNNDWYKLLVTGYSLKDYNETSSTSGNPTSFTGTAYELPFSGYWSYSQTTPQSQGTRGYWWSSTVYGTGIAYYTYVYNYGYVSAGTYDNNKRYGYSVRCMLSAS